MNFRQDSKDREFENATLSYRNHMLRGTPQISENLFVAQTTTAVIQAQMRKER